MHYEVRLAVPVAIVSSRSAAESIAGRSGARL